MGNFQDVLANFAVALEPGNVLIVLLGVSIGMVIGVLPGLGPTATMALLLPVTWTMEPASAIIMLAGIYYGSMYGGTITSILLRIPGEAASVVTCIDGHEMARDGRAGPALGIAAVGSFIGGLAATLALVLFAPLIANVALAFGPPEFALIALMGILLACYLGTGSAVMAIASAALGLLLATIGQDPVLGSARFTLGNVNLLGGLSFVALAMGLFGVGEVLSNLDEGYHGRKIASKIHRVLPSRSDLKTSSGSIGRGSLLGMVIGLFPGGGGLVSSLASYGLEKRIAKEPSRFGRGAIEGVAGPETANNSGATSAFLPLLTLGIPSNSALAVLFGALLMQGITPGPRLMTVHPDIFWGVIASMFVGNLFLIILNIPLLGIFVRIVRVRLSILAPLAATITVIGVYSVNNSQFDMFVVVTFGVLGYLMRKLRFEPGPLLLAFVLGPILEQSFRQSMLLSNGSLSIFLSGKVNLILLGLGAVAIVLSLLERRMQRRAVSSAEALLHEPDTR